MIPPEDLEEELKTELLNAAIFAGDPVLAV